ncbi:HEPN domain-containing protein [Thermatribacter velox]|uniref:HEPN domain-containing protein n=1 Tax=Thermatribacter velox TaxID=3039681 RepID=A0ABZ2YA46_9BACT
MSKELIEDYLKRAKIRLRLLEEFLKEKDYADVIRVSQEVVELAQKAILLKMGITPPKWHEVIDIILENREKLPQDVFLKLVELRRDSKWLRSQREIAFYGDVDFVPTKEYVPEDAQRAISVAKEFMDLASLITTLK